MIQRSVPKKSLKGLWIDERRTVTCYDDADNVGAGWRGAGRGGLPAEDLLAIKSGRCKSKVQRFVARRKRYSNSTVYTFDL